MMGECRRGHRRLGSLVKQFACLRCRCVVETTSGTYSDTRDSRAEAFLDTEFKKHGREGFHSHPMCDISEAVFAIWLEEGREEAATRLAQLWATDVDEFSRVMHVIEKLYIPAANEKTA